MLVGLCFEVKCVDEILNINKKIVSLKREVMYNIYHMDEVLKKNENELDLNKSKLSIW